MKMNIEYPQSILKSQLFASLKDAEMKLLIRDASMKNYKTGDVILREGEDGKEFYWIASGRVDVQLAPTVASSPVISLSTLGPGDVLGEMIILGFSKRAASAVVKSDAQIYSFDMQKCQELFIEHPIIGYRVTRNLGHMLGKRLVATNQLLRGRTELLDSNLMKNIATDFK